MNQTTSGARDNLERTVAAMARIGACWSPTFSPDGTRIACVSNLSGLPQVWIVPVEGGWPRLVTALDDQVVSVAWSPVDDWLAFALAPGGGMNQQVYIVRPDGTDLQRLTDGGAENNWLGRWTHDGRALMISSNRRGADAMDAYLVDTAGNWRLIAENRGIGSLCDISRDFRYAILYRMEHRSDDNLFLLDLETGNEQLLTPHEGPGSFEQGLFATDGATIYLLSNSGRERTAFARIRLENGSPGPIEVIVGRDDAELETFELSEDGSVAVLIWNSSGRSELSFVDLASHEQVAGPEGPTELLGDPCFSHDGHRIVLSANGSNAPRDIWIFDRQLDQMRQVSYSSHAGVALDGLVRPELVEFSAHDDLPLSAWLYRASDRDAAGPFVLSFHGGPEGQERPVFNSTYQALLAQGISVLAPNVRGSSGFGKTFVNLDNGALRVHAVRDIKACVDYVVDAGLADPRRIGIMGGSYGGYMTMAGLAEYPDLLAAGANLYGIVNFETFFQQTEPWMAAISKVEYGDPETEAAMLRDLSPIHKIDRIKAPTLVLHGANDTNVPVVEAEQIVAQLKARDVPVEYVLFPDEGHGFTKMPNRIRSTLAIVRWFVEHLG